MPGKYDYYEDEEERAPMQVKLWKPGRSDDDDDDEVPDWHPLELLSVPEMKGKHGVLFRCVNNSHHQKLIPVTEAGNLIGPPACDECGSTMVVAKVKLDSSRKKKKRR